MFYVSTSVQYTRADGPDRETVRRDQDAEYQRACEVDEARQRLAGPVDEDAVRSTRLRHWLQSP